MTINHYINLVIIVFFMVFAAATTYDTFVYISEREVRYHEDKTIQFSEGLVYMAEKWKTGRDIIMALTVLDEFTPEPKAIKINDNPVIRINTDFVSQKWNYLSAYYYGAGQNLQAIEDHKITSIRYIEGATVGGVYVDPYLQIDLEP